jgi:phosphohistidine phosphatase
MAARDDDRCLTERGQADCAAVYSQCRGLVNESAVTVVVSPLVRAQQTAGIALRQLGLADNNSITSELLRPEANLKLLTNWLDQSDVKAMLLVGHQPLLGNLLAWLCDDRSLAYEVATASVHGLDVVGFCRGGASLSWRRTPF